MLSSPLRPSHHLARLDIAYVCGIHKVERASLRSHQPRIAQATKRERPETARIPDSEQLVAAKQHERIGALDLVESFGKGAG